MSGPLTLTITAKPKNDQVQDFVNDAVKTFHEDAGTLTYRVFDKEDGNVFFYEDYESSEALLAHMQHSQDAGVSDRMMECLDITDVTVLGTPTATARDALAAWGTNFAAHNAGFSRLGRMEASV